jgi:hypothetical protein
MDWYYDAGGQQSGPVPESQLDELVRSGAVQHDTLVWRSGMPDWQPLHQARPSNAIPPLAPPVLPPIINGGIGDVCVECRRPFPQSEMVLLNNSWVCAQCKPIFLQRLMEGSAPGSATLTGGLVWRYERQMVTRSDTPLPDRCVRCNAPAKGFRLKRKLSWHPPAYFLLAFAGLLVYIIVAMCVRKEATLYIGLCETHRAQRTRFILGSVIGGLIGLGLLLVGAAYQSGVLAFTGLVLILTAMILAAVKAPVISTAKIENDFVWVKGANDAFLAELPEWPGPG